MTRYMLDTNTVSHLLKKHPAVARRVVAVPITALCISVITQGELLFGLARRPDAVALHDVVREFLRRVDVLPWGCGGGRGLRAHPGRYATPGLATCADGSLDRHTCHEHRCRLGDQ